VTILLARYGYLHDDDASRGPLVVPIGNFSRTPLPRRPILVPGRDVGNEVRTVAGVFTGWEAGRPQTSSTRAQ